ncbi:type II toxin-antitoxin system PemK/MazF family toxin [Patescibacteria group bacterium]
MHRKGKIILIPFPFTDLSSSKVRPAVIVSNIKHGGDLVVVFISSVKTKRLQNTDVVVKSTSKNFSETGLKVDSIIKVGKIATLDKKIVLGEIGEVSEAIEKEINKRIKILFGLS